MRQLVVKMVARCLLGDVSMLKMRELGNSMEHGRIDIRSCRIKINFREQKLFSLTRLQCVSFNTDRLTGGLSKILIRPLLDCCSGVGGDKCAVNHRGAISGLALTKLSDRIRPEDCKQFF